MRLWTCDGRSTRPPRATIRTGSFDTPIPMEETWEFQSGSVVRCELRELNGRTSLGRGRARARLNLG